MPFRNKTRRELRINDDFLGIEIRILKEPTVSPPFGREWKPLSYEQGQEQDKASSFCFYSTLSLKA